LALFILYEWRMVDENFIGMKLDEKNSRQSKSEAVEGYNSCFRPTQLAWLTHTIGKGEVAVCVRDFLGGR